MNHFSRRKLLDGTGRVLATAALTLPGLNAADNPQLPRGLAADRKLKVIVAGGHPGDPEYGCGGTIARYTDLGHDVALLYLNHGEGGSPKLPDGKLGVLRSEEARKACAILKARPLYAAQLDGKPIIDPAHTAEFRNILASEKPDVVFTQWPIDNHPDHRATSMLVYDAWLAMNRAFAFYYYEVSNGEDTVMFSPTLYVDISAVERRKRDACYAHASQTPDRYYALQTEVARFRGFEGGFAQAEAFVRHVQSPSCLLPGEI